MWIVCVQALCRCFCLLRVWKTWGRPPPPKTMSSVRSCSAFSTKAWTSEACTAGTLRTVTRSFRFCARGVWVNFLFVIKHMKSVICSAGAMCLFWCHILFATGQTCVDIKDNVVNEGYYFTPKGDDPCLSCTCHDGEPEMCVAALCERPQGCQHFRKDPKECCKFTCLDPGTTTASEHMPLVTNHHQCVIIISD